MNCKKTEKTSARNEFNFTFNIKILIPELFFRKYKNNIQLITKSENVTYENVQNVSLRKTFLEILLIQRDSLGGFIENVIQASANSRFRP